MGERRGRDAIDRMLHLNLDVVTKNVHDVLPHRVAPKTGDIIVTGSLAAHVQRMGAAQCTMMNAASSRRTKRPVIDTGRTDDSPAPGSTGHELACASPAVAAPRR
jgi:hypothetical protein